MKVKYYVVWKGRKPGIYTSWQECNEQISGFPGAEYKSFKTLQIAQEAFKRPSSEYIGNDVFESELTPEALKKIGKHIEDSIAVDAAWNTFTRQMEYQGVFTKTGEKIFIMGPFDDGTNNVGEFLALVHALAYCKKNKLQLPIYSDSMNAISWVKDKEARTNLEKTEKNEELFKLIDRALKWLNENSYENKILKWETKAWGENPADFGRK